MSSEGYNPNPGATPDSTPSSNPIPSVGDRGDQSTYPSWRRIGFQWGAGPEFQAQVRRGNNTIPFSCGPNNLTYTAKISPSSFPVNIEVTGADVYHKVTIVQAGKAKNVGNGITQVPASGTKYAVCSVRVP